MTGSQRVVEVDLSRRGVLRAAAMGGAFLGIPWTGTAWAAPAVPQVPFAPNRTKDGIVSAFGEARLGKIGDASVPVQLISLGGLAVMDAMGRNAIVRLGADATQITLTSKGVEFGKGAKLAEWNPKTIQTLIEQIAKDRNKTRGAMMLRSTFHTAYPVALMQLKGTIGKGGAGVANALAKGSKALGFDTKVNCTTTTVTETVVTTITEFINVWKTAEQQYAECYDREVARDPCKAAGLGAGLCAAGICAVQAFVDMVVGVVEVVTTLVEEVVRTVVTCIVPPKGFWPSPWDIPNPLDGKILLPQPAAAFKPEDVSAAIKLLKDITGFFGPFAKCLIGGKWSLAQLKTPLQLAGNNVVIPYGIKVCVSAECARSMAITNVFGELGASWTAALGILAALSTEFAAFAATLGLPAVPAVVTAAVAAVGGAGSVVATCAAIILAFVILALIYGTAISAQLAFHATFTNNLADGEVCIEHATFALALIKMATLGFVASELIPPIVTG